MAARRTPQALLQKAQRTEAAYERAMELLDKIEDSEASGGSPEKIEKLETQFAEAWAKAADLHEELIAMAGSLFDEYQQADAGFWKTR